MEQVTTEFLSAMFGAYLNCEVSVNAALYLPNRNSKNAKGNPIMSPSVLADCHEKTFSYRDFMLILTPLSEITEEDELELMEMVKCCNFIIDKEIFIAQLICALNPGNELPGSMVRWCVDYLRSRGYDCGFRHITSLIDAGLAVKAETIDYKAEVLKVYPDAFCDYGDVDDYTCHYWITTPHLDDLCQTIGQIVKSGQWGAWQSAYETLKKQGKL